MEYVDGVSLQEAVARGGTFAGGEAASVAVQVADGLARAASVGLVHRDIKPANVLIDRRGAVKILDLGIARFTHDDTHSRLNGMELIVGTLDYLAPEQALDSCEVDSRADLYALGCTLYFLLTGHPPYPGNDVRWKMQAKQTTDPHPLEQLRPDLPREMAAAVHRLMARDPADRYPTPGAAAETFRAWAAPGSGFPARLFCPSASTAHDRASEPEAEHDPLPDTLRINKAGTRLAPALGARAFASSPVNAPTPVPGPEDVPAPGPAPARRAVGRVGLAALLVVLIALLAALAALASR
jgi:serine/threonine protein kinase